MLVVTAAQDTAAVNDDCCEVCLVAERDARIALVPCGHQRFCESCANEVLDNVDLYSASS